MIEDEDHARRADGVPRLLDVSRRAVLHGMTATVAMAGTGIGLAAASELPTVLTVDYADLARRKLRIALDEETGVGRDQQDRSRVGSWILSSDLFGNPDDPVNPARFVRRRGNDRIEAWIENASLPGGRPFLLTFDFSRAPLVEADPLKARPWSVSVRISAGWLGRDIVMGARSGGPLPVRDLLTAGPQDEDRHLCVTFGDSDADALLGRLFGERVRFDAKQVRNATATLRLVPSRAAVNSSRLPGQEASSAIQEQGQALHWCLSAVDKASRLVLFRGRVEFTRLNFGILTQEVVAAGAFRIGQTESRDVRDLFSDEGDDASRTNGAAGTGPREGRVLYGLAADVPVLSRSPSNPGGAFFEIGNRGGIAVRIGEMPPDLGMTCPAASVAIEAVAFRNSGEPVRTVAVVHGAFHLYVTSPGARSEGPFVIRKGVVERAERPPSPQREGGLWTTARLEPAEKDHRVRTRNGVLVLRGHEPIPPGDGRASRVPPIVVEAFGDSDERELRKFEALLRITHYAIPLPASGEGSTRTAEASAAAGISSRLDFASTPCSFYVPGLGEPMLQRPGAGVFALGDVAPRRGTAAPLFQNPSVRLSLDGATLRVKRASDLLDLTYRFVDLVLQVDRGTARIVPDASVSARANMRPVKPPSLFAALVSERSAGSGQDWAGPPVDTRPLLIVDLPPQHVAERAFLRQLPSEPELPDVAIPSGCDERYTAALQKLESLEESERLQGRKEIRKIKVEASNGGVFKEFADHIAKSEELRDFPKEFRIYAGPAFLNPVAQVPHPEFRSRLRVAARKYWEGRNSPVGRLGLLPDVPLNPQEEARIRSEGEGHPDDRVERAKERRDDDYRVFRERFAKAILEPGTKLLSEMRDGQEVNAYYGRDNYIKRVQSRTGSENVFAKAILDLLNGELPEHERIPPFVEGRLAGPSRLAFRVNCDGPEDARAEKPSFDMPRGGFAFTLEALTKWGAFDLSVVRRAEKLFERDRAGRLPPRHARTEVVDDARILRHQLWPALTGPDDRAPPVVSGRDRIRQIIDATKDPPLWTETAIELPFRLLLSPAQDALWRTPGVVPEGVYSRPAAGEIQRDETTPLWFATLDGGPAPTVRAVWSRDFRPGAFAGDKDGAPIRGPWAPWAIPKGIHSESPRGTGPELPRFRTSLDAFDRHELVALTSIHGIPVRGRRKLDEVGKTYVLVDGRQIEPPDGYRLQDASQEALSPSVPSADLSAIYKPQALTVPELTLTSLGGTLELDTTFVPPASAQVGQAKANLFTALTIERWRHRTVLGRDVSVEVVYKGFLFPTGHRASLVKVTERIFARNPHPDPFDTRGRGYPTAYLIQRMFVRVGERSKTYPALGQPNGGRRWPVDRLDVITQQTPDLVDPMEDLSADGVEAKGGRVLLTVKSETGASPMRGLVFWPRMARRSGAEVRFQLQINQTGGAVEFPLLFVDNAAANDEAMLRELVRYYNALGDEPLFPEAPGDRRRIMEHGGLKRRYAPENTTDEASHETIRWLIQAEGQERTPLPTDPDLDEWPVPDNGRHDFDPLLQGVDQPPFYPLISQAQVQLKQVARLSGGEVAPAVVTYDIRYAALGFPARPGGTASRTPGRPEDVYLRIAKVVPLDLGRRGDRTGGLGRPEAHLVAISRAQGPLGGDPKAPTLTSDPGRRITTVTAQFKNGFEPDKFFSDGAKLLGIIGLKEVVAAAASIADAPALRETLHFAGALVDSAARDEAVLRRLMRDRVLVPIRGILVEFEKDWATANGGTADSEKVKATLARLYPDIGKSFRDLREKLDVSIALAGDADPSGAFYAHISDAYESGRRFVAAIERTAADPTAPVREELRRVYRSAVLRFTLVEETLRQKLESYAKGRRMETRRQLIALLGKPELRTYRRLVFALPAVFDDTIPNAVRDAATAAIEDAFQASLPEYFPNDGAPLNPAALKEAFLRNLEIQEKELTDRGEEAAAAALKAVRAAWQRDLDAGLVQLQGFLYGRLTAHLQGILNAAAGFESITFDRVEQFAFEFAQAIQIAVRAALQFAENALVAKLFERFCGEAAGALVETVTLIAPMPTGAVVCTPPGPSGGGCTLPPLNAPSDGTAFEPREICANIVGLADALSCLELRLIDLAERLRAETPPPEAEVLATVEKAIAAAGDFRKAVAGTGRTLAEAIVAHDAAIARLLAAANDLDDFRARTCERFDPKKIPDLPLAAFSDVARTHVALVRAATELASSLSARKETVGDWAAWLIPAVYLGQSTVPSGAVEALVALIKKVVSPSERQALEDAVGTATTTVAGTAFSLMRLLSDVTALAAEIATADAARRKQALEGLRDRAKSITAALPPAGPASEAARRLIAEPLNEAVQRLSDEALKAAAQPVKEARAALQELRDRAVTASGDAQKRIQDIASRVGTLGENAEALYKALTLEVSDKLIAWAATGLSSGTEFAEAVLAEVALIVSPALVGLDQLYDGILLTRNKLHAQLTAATPTAGTGLPDELDAILGSAGLEVRRQIAHHLIVPDLANPEAGDLTPDNDALAREARDVHHVAKLAGSNTPSDLWAAQAEIAALSDRWKKGSAIQRLAGQLAAAGETLLRGDLVRILDLTGYARRIEARLKELIPAELALAYSLDARLNKIPAQGAPLFKPEGDKSLRLRSRVTINLLKTGATRSANPEMSVQASLDPFSIHLFGAMDIVTLKFGGASFSSTGDGGSDFKVKFDGIELGREAEFLKKLESYLKPRDGNGPYVVPMSQRPGIEAGYGLKLGTISIGTVSFLNVSLNASCELPFDRSDALFRIAIGRRDAPFMISAAPYGGGGFLALVANAKRIVGLEGSFEFGGVGAFSFGPLSGEGRITLGFYLEEGAAGRCVSGFFFAGGSASLACFAISAALSVEMTKKPGGPMQGSATFSFSFSVGLGEITYAVTVQRNEGAALGEGGGQQQALLPRPPVQLAHLDADDALRLAAESLRIQTAPRNRLVSVVTPQARNWKGYLEHFDPQFRGLPS